jgi:octaprenyl-diphosphate synthase
VTLPLIHAMRKGTSAEQALIENAVTSKSAAQIAEILAAVRRCGSLDYTRSQAGHYHDLALAQLQDLPASQSREALQQITHLSIHRDK